MVHDANGYRLSEAFDLVPDVGDRSEHCLAFEYERFAPTRAQLLAVADRWGVSDADAHIDAMLASIDLFAARAEGHAVPPSNIEELATDIARRRARLSAK